MNKGWLLAVTLAAATVGLVAIGTLWPVSTAAAYAGANQFAHPFEHVARGRPACEHRGPRVVDQRHALRREAE